MSSVWLLGEDIGPGTIIGGAIVLAGLWLVEHPGTGQRPVTTPQRHAPAHEEA